MAGEYVITEDCSKCGNRDSADCFGETEKESFILPDKVTESFPEEARVFDVALEE